MLERIQAALDQAFDEQVASRFAAYNGWITAGPHKLKDLGVDDPDVAFEASLRELKDAYQRAQIIAAKVFRP